MKPSPYLTPQRHNNIIPVVERFFGLRKNELYTRTHKRRITEPRQIIFWIEYMNNMKYFGSPKYREITELFLYKNNIPFGHATVIHAVKTVNNLMSTDRDYRQKVYKLQNEIFGNVPFLMSKS